MLSLGPFNDMPRVRQRIGDRRHDPPRRLVSKAGSWAAALDRAWRSSAVPPQPRLVRDVCSPGQWPAPFDGPAVPTTSPRCPVRRASFPVLIPCG